MCSNWAHSSSSNGSILSPNCRFHNSIRLESGKKIMWGEVFIECIQLPFATKECMNSREKIDDFLYNVFEQSVFSSPLVLCVIFFLYIYIISLSHSTSQQTPLHCCTVNGTRIVPRREFLHSKQKKKIKRFRKLTALFDEIHFAVRFFLHSSATHHFWWWHDGFYDPTTSSSSSTATSTTCTRLYLFKWKRHSCRERMDRVQVNIEWNKMQCNTEPLPVLIHSFSACCGNVTCWRNCQRCHCHIIINLKILINTNLAHVMNAKYFFFYKYKKNTIHFCIQSKLQAGA